MKTSILERILVFLSIKKNSLSSEHTNQVVKPKKVLRSRFVTRKTRKENVPVNMQRVDKLYTPTITSYDLSRSRIEDFVKCARCFYIDRKLGVKQPEIPKFLLNLAVDALLKNEFDIYRERQISHPLCVQYHMDHMVPFEHPDLNKWRKKEEGIRYKIPNTNIIFYGIIDDIWINTKTKELFLVDYKSTAKNEPIILDDDKYKQGYYRQAEMYQWLFRKNNFNVSNTFYFVYCNGILKLPRFDRSLHFDISILPYQGDDSWVEPTLIKAYQCLQSNEIPPFTASCQHCQFLKAMNAHAES